MATQVNMFEAKTQLSKLVEMAERGQDVIIARNGKPAARLTALQPEKKPLVFGLMKGQIHYSDDFDAPLPDEILAEFAGDIFPPASPGKVNAEARPAKVEIGRP